MTVHDLHDALNLLPGDLITATDRLRTAPKPQIIPWKRIIPMAACLALLISCGSWLLWREHLLSHIGGIAHLEMKQEAAPEAPAAAAPPMQEDGIITEIPAEEAAAEAPAQDSASATGGEAGTENSLCIDHSHRFAGEGDPGEDVPSGYCGNLITTVYMDGTEYSLTGADGMAITDILTNLDYDPDAVCRCMAEFTVDTELLTDIEVNLTQGFARCEKGQAALTEKQAGILQKIIDNLA